VPNGGSDYRGTCWFNERNEGLPQLLRDHHGNDPEIGENSLEVLTRLQPDMGQTQAKALSVVAPRLWHRLVSTLAHVLGIGLVGLALHEFFHLVVLQALGGGGVYNLRLGAWVHPFHRTAEPPVGGTTQRWIAHGSLLTFCLLVLGLVKPDRPQSEYRGGGFGLGFGELGLCTHRDDDHLAYGGNDRVRNRLYYGRTVIFYEADELAGHR